MDGSLIRSLVLGQMEGPRPRGRSGRGGTFWMRGQMIVWMGNEYPVCVWINTSRKGTKEGTYYCAVQIQLQRMPNEGMKPWKARDRK